MICVIFRFPVSFMCTYTPYTATADLVEQDYRDPKVLAVWGSLVAGDTGAILANRNELKSQVSQFLCYSWAHSSLHSWVQLVVLLALKTQSHSNYDYDWTFWYLDLAHVYTGCRMLCSCKLASHGTFSPRHKSLRPAHQKAGTGRNYFGIKLPISSSHSKTPTPPDHTNSDKFNFKKSTISKRSLNNNSAGC